jgi:hypothetical protein
MAPVRRRTTALLVVAGLLLAAVVGLGWLLVGRATGPASPRPGRPPP